MTQNIHDALTIGIPTAAVLFGVLSTLLVNNRRFDKVDQRFDKQDARLDRIELKMERNFEIVHADLRTFYTLNSELKGRADELKSRIEAIEKRIS